MNKKNKEYNENKEIENFDELSEERQKEVSEILKLVAEVDLSSDQKLINFEIWKKMDGTLEGIKRLLEINNQDK